MTNINKKRNAIISIFISVGIISALFYDINVEEFIIATKMLIYHYLIFIFLAQMISFMIRVERFKLIMNYQNRFVLFSISAIHNFLNRILPMRMGELSIPILFQKYTKLPFLHGIGALLLFRCLDVVCLLILFLIASFFVNVDLNLKLLRVISIILVIFLMLFLFKINAASILLRRLIHRANFIRFKRIKEETINKLMEFEDIRKRNDSNLGLLIILSILNWIITYFIYYLICLAFRMDYSYFQVIIAATLVTFISNFSVNSVGRFGIFEAGWAAGFILIGLDKDFAIPMGLFTNIYITIVNGFFALLGYCFLSGVNPIDCTKCD